MRLEPHHLDTARRQQRKKKITRAALYRRHSHERHLHPLFPKVCTKQHSHRQTNANKQPIARPRSSRAVSCGPATRISNENSKRATKDQPFENVPVTYLARKMRRGNQLKIATLPVNEAAQVRQRKGHTRPCRRRQRNKSFFCSRRAHLAPAPRGARAGAAAPQTDPLPGQASQHHQHQRLCFLTSGAAISRSMNLPKEAPYTRRTSCDRIRSRVTP